MNKQRIKRVSFLLLFIFFFAANPSLAPHADAMNQMPPGIRYTIKYKVTVKWKKKKKKAKPKLTQKRITTSQGEIVTIALSNAKAKKIKWSSSKKKVATIKKSGNSCIITANNPGKATITAKYKGKKYKCKLTVTNKKDTAFYCNELSNGETLLFTKSNKYSDSFDFNPNSMLSFQKCVYPVTLYYSIDNPNIATYQKQLSDSLEFISIEPKSIGETWLTVSNSYNSQVMRFKIKVNPCYIEVLDRELFFDEYGGEAEIRVRCPDDVSSLDYEILGNGCTITRSEKKDGLFSFYVKPYSNGSSYIYFRDKDKKYESDSASVKVQVGNEAITIDQPQIELSKGESIDIPINTDKGLPIIISSSSAGVSCTNNGLINGTKSFSLTITGNNIGNATITIKDAVNKSITQKISVSVTEPYVEVEGVSLNKKTLRLTFFSAYSNQAVLKATINPANATNKTLTWTSSDDSVVTVDENGYVKGLRTGKATITVSTYNGFTSSCEVSVDQ